MEHRHTSSSQHGFTLIELMVVVAIVAILAAMAAPSYRDMIDRFRLRGAADDVLSVLSTARAQTVKLGLDSSISSTAGANWCVGAKSATVPTGGAAAGVSAGCDCASPSACLVGDDQVAIPAGKHGAVSMRTASTFVFDGKLGTVLDSSGAIAPPTAMTLTSPSGKYDIDIAVTPLGQARLCTPAGKPAMAGVASC